MSTDITDNELQALNERWAQQPSPHLALQLADAYRQRGQIAQALPILERGLEVRPNHVSTQVALGRYRLEAADAEGAARVLRRVVDKDPGHLVANKLLVRAHLALGDRNGAADRLDLYALLNDGDPDLDALRSAVESAPPPSPVIEGPPPLPAAFGAAATVPVADLASLARPGKRSVSGAIGRDPFAELSSDPLVADALPGFLRQTVATPVPDPVPAPVPAPIPVYDESTEALPAEESAKEPVAPDAVVEAPPIAPPAPEETEAGAGATATLGSLYLAQGHFADAQRTFEQVLARDPDDIEAQAGMTEIARRASTAPTDPAPADSPRTMKIARLERYLSRIRAAAERLSA